MLHVSCEMRAHLLGFNAGENFTYTERQRVPGPIVGAFISSLFIVFGLLALFPPLKPLWKNLLPRLGGKPTEDTMKNGFWKMQLVGQSEPDSSGKATTVVAQLSVSSALLCAPFHSLETQAQTSYMRTCLHACARSFGLPSPLSASMAISTPPSFSPKGLGEAANVKSSEYVFKTVVMLGPASEISSVLKASLEIPPEVDSVAHLLLRCAAPSSAESVVVAGITV